MKIKIKKIKDNRPRSAVIINKAIFETILPDKKFWDIKTLVFETEFDIVNNKLRNKRFKLKENKVIDLR